MKYNETADDDAYVRSGDEAIDEPRPRVNPSMKSGSGLGGTMGKRLSKLYNRASTSVKAGDLPEHVAEELARFNLSKEEEKALFDLHMNTVNHEEEEEEKIQSAAEYIESTE